LDGSETKKKGGFLLQMTKQETLKNQISEMEKLVKILNNPNRNDHFELAIRYMVIGWLEYAEAHKIRYGTKVGEDCVIGAEWEVIGDALKGLLGGDCGARFDCGTLARFIRSTMILNGCCEEENKQ
jgi:hypothetical protein